MLIQQGHPSVQVNSIGLSIGSTLSRSCIASLALANLVNPTITIDLIALRNYLYTIPLA
jgi:hypothetical protein